MPRRQFRKAHPGLAMMRRGDGPEAYILVHTAKEAQSHLMMIMDVAGHMRSFGV